MNRYFVERKLATGVGTELSLCRLNEEQGQPVVVKELIDVQHLDNLETEFEVLRSISPHPGIINLIDGFIFKEKAFLVYDYCSGGDLFNVIKTKGPLTESQSVSLLSQMVSALQHARNHGFFHCDLKPENILLKSSAEFILADWDMARHSHQLRVSMHYGSTLSMAPEVMLGQLHENSDIYSLGCLMHYCLFGARVFNLTSASLPHERIFAHLEQTYEMPDGKCGANLKALICRMMAKNPDDRASLAEIHDYLEGHRLVVPQPDLSSDIYDAVPTIVSPRYADICKEKSIRRIQAHQNDPGDTRGQSLILAHRLILAYLGDIESQEFLASAYRSSTLLHSFPDRGQTWLDRAESLPL